MTENTPPPTLDEDPPEAPEPAQDGDRYAVYDDVLLRYVGPVTDKRPSAKAVKALVGDHKHTVRKV